MEDRIVYGCLPDVEARLRIVYGYRIWGLRLTDCLFLSGLPDLGEEAYGLFTDYGFLPDLEGGGLRIAYGFLFLSDLGGGGLRIVRMLAGFGGGGLTDGLFTD